MASSSPDNEYFSTPPSTPNFPSAIAPSLFRKNSRPSSLQITSDNSQPGVVVETSSPQSRTTGSSLSPSPPTATDTAQGASGFLSPALGSQHSRVLERAMQSPCFIHSHLDKGASLGDWLQSKHQANDPALGVARSLLLRNGSKPDAVLHDKITPHPDDDDMIGGSLTEQLAETAVGVREMSKQLGRARVLSNIQHVLIITKARDNRLIKLTRQLALYLMLKQRKGQQRGLVVYVDNQLRHSRRFDAEGIARDYPQLMVPFPRRRSSSSNSLSSMTSNSAHKDEYIGQDEGQLRYWTHDMCSQSPHLFDFVATLGGDGTVLFTSWLFQRIVPPVLSFALGSLGFLTNFDFADHQAVMDSAIDTGIRVNLRMRFTCTVYRADVNPKGNERKAVKKGETGEIMMKNVEKGGWEALEGGWSGMSTEGIKGSKDKEIMCFTTRPAERFEVLNDLVVDRGPSPYVSLLELFGDEHHMTTVQADGLTVSTPTGSTAYSLSAGGSLVHPEIPALLITPICPHTLSFRPMLLPDTMELRICVPFNSRSTAWASFDGRGRVELKQGDHIKVTASKYPFPTVCADKQSTDWFHSISRTLKWNERERQKSFVVVEEDKPKATNHRKSGNVSTPEDTDSLDEEDEVSEEEEDDKFDIDDSSPEAAEAKAAAQERSQRRRSKSRSRSRSSGIRSGVNTPGRFAGSQPHPPPAIASRHVNFSPSSQSSSSTDFSTTDAAHHGISDELPLLRLSGKGRSLHLDAESMKTPTVANAKFRSQHHAGAEFQSPRAFAAWGQDESDSNASDSDA